MREPVASCDSCVDADDVGDCNAWKLIKKLIIVVDLDKRDHCSRSSSSNVSATAIESKRVQLFRALKLANFNEAETTRAYDMISRQGLEKQENEGSEKELFNQEDIRDLLRSNEIISKHDGKVPSREEFHSRIVQLGEKLDPRVWPLGLSFLGTGLSIGIIVPILPLLVEQLHINSSEFGVVVSAFGLSKLVGNFPAAQWISKHGTKLVMVNGLLLCGIGISSISLSLDFGITSLVMSRLLTGFGVALFTGGAFNMIADISTSLNRTRTLAPVTASFQAGTALGPALGGLAVTSVGIGSCYNICGGLLVALAGLNHLFLQPAQPIDHHQQQQEQQRKVVDTKEVVNSNHKEENNENSKNGPSFGKSMVHWTNLMKQPKIGSVVKANLVYWIGLSGASLTLLPLYMVQLQLSPTEIGFCFAFSSTMSVLASQPAAYLADKWGKDRMIATGMGILGMSFLAMPYAQSFEYLMACLAPVSFGSTILSAVPTAYMGDLVSSKERPQALAFLRTAGDVGLLIGAISSGILSDFSSIGSAIQANGGLLTMLASLWVIRGGDSRFKNS